MRIYQKEGDFRGMGLSEVSHLFTKALTSNMKRKLGLKDIHIEFKKRLQQ